MKEQLEKSLDEKAKSLGASFKIEVEEVVDGETKKVTGYLKKPDRTLYSACIKLLEVDTLKANETLLRSCLIKEVSDMRLVDDDDIFMNVLPQLSNLIQKKRSTLTTL
jgi:hypothetical protein